VVQVYDTLRALEVSVEAVHKECFAAAVAAKVAAGQDQAAADAAASQDCMVGLGVTTRLVEGLHFEFYQSYGSWGAHSNCTALLHLLGVVSRDSSSYPSTPDAASTRSSLGAGGAGGAGGAKYMSLMALKLSQPVLVSVCTAALLQSLERGNGKSSGLALPGVSLVGCGGGGKLRGGAAVWHELGCVCVCVCNRNMYNMHNIYPYKHTVCV
jgi:hypothetical protein